MSPFVKTLIPALMLTASLGLAHPVAASPAADWSPRASEKLIKLPGHFLKKAVENDYAKSPLASALIDLDEQISFKADTLKDLQDASDRASGDLKEELDHQTLAEKQRYIRMMSDHQDLRRKRAQTKIRLYEKLLRKLNREKRGQTPQKAKLIAKQTQAVERMNATRSLIDTKLMKSSFTSESRYARDYATNLAAVENLVQAIKDHPMNRAAEQDGQPVTQAEYVRQLIATNEAELSIVNQERVIIGYMAKLVALDALAITEGLDASDESGMSDCAEPETTRVSSAVSFFITQ